ncbi:sensor histidine kinase KdpD, partial [Acidovorax sp. A1169]|uniref:sensor histidine kinase n=1 Tax=Acidovorax sp. A1169 TaxID=3059524 RepID=UPI002737B7DD
YGPGKPICVSLERLPMEAVLSVSDGGRGIAQADCGRIFERFERAGDYGAAPGLGLGLYISRQIAREHGGSIDVRSELGCGSVFKLHLPLPA